MNGYELIPLLAQAETESNPVLGLLMLGGIVWLLFTVFGKKKDKYLVTHETSVRKLK